MKRNVYVLYRMAYTNHANYGNNITLLLKMSITLLQIKFHSYENNIRKKKLKNMK